jgi:hypothetical protein
MPRIFKHLQIPFRATPFFSHAYKTAGVGHPPAFLEDARGLASSGHQPELQGRQAKASGSNGEPELQGMHITAERIDHYGVDCVSARRATSNLE